MVSKCARGQEDELMDADKVDCLLARLMYKNLMKRYIAREGSTVVLSKAGAFPGTGVFDGGIPRYL